MENVKDVAFGFQTVTSDVSKLSNFFTLKMVKRLYVEKSLDPTTVSNSKMKERDNKTFDIYCVTNMLTGCNLNPTLKLI